MPISLDSLVPELPPQSARPFPLFRAGVIVVIPSAAAALLFATLMPLSLESDGPIFTIFSYTSFMLRTFWFHIGLGLLPLVALALWLRMRPLAVLGGLLVIWTISPAAWSLRPRSPAPLPGPTLTVLSMNLYLKNRDTSAILAQVAQHDPDIILLQEYTPEIHEILSGALADRYPYSVNFGRDDSFGQATYSKLPFIGAPIPYPQGRDASRPIPVGLVGSHDPQIRVRVSLGGREVVIQNVHFSSPVSLDCFRDERRSFAWISDWAAREHGPMIIGGDMNATPDSAEVRSLLSTGLENSQAVAGHGRGATWPDKTPLRFFPGVKIDQLLFKGLKCDFAAVGGPNGSDHRPIIARFGFAD